MRHIRSLLPSCSSLTRCICSLWIISILVATVSADSVEENAKELEGSSNLSAAVIPVEELRSSGLSYIDAIVLGVVEGLTEYLPVSSTGHLILADRFMEGDAKDVSSEISEARNAYLIVIQGGAILAVMFLYWRKLLGILMGLIGRDPAGLALGLKILVGFLPAALAGPFLNDWIESKLFNSTAVAVALTVGAVVMILVEWNRKRKHGNDNLESSKTEKGSIETLSYKGALLVGVMQCLAMWPGMSRSMVTIVGGYLAGLSAKSAAEFSFLLGFLTLSAASAYSLLGSWDVLVRTIEPGPALTGIAIATIVAFVAVKWFVGFLAKHGLLLFAYYRIALAVLIVLVLN